MTRGLRRGSTYFEVLAGMLLASVGIAAMFGLYSTVMGMILRSSRVVIAGELARQDLEKIKVQGFAYFPKGTTFTTLTACVAGDIYPLAQNTGCMRTTWSGPTSYYNANGVLLSSTAPATERVFSLQRTAIEVLVIASGSSYEVKEGGLRKITTTVRMVEDNSVAAAMGVTLTKRGL